MEEKNESKKLSYEQLEQYAAQMSQQAQQLFSKLREANLTNMFKRLDYLFKILEHKEVFDNNIVDKCVSEIITIMTPPETESEEEKEEEDK